MAHPASLAAKGTYCHAVFGKVDVAPTQASHLARTDSRIKQKRDGGDTIAVLAGLRR